MAKKHKYNKSEFINILCKRCDLCKNTEDPAFCYNIIYKKHKRKFVQKVFPKLLKLKTEEKLSGIPICNYNSKNFELMFKQTFCNSGVCGKNIENCDSVLKCITIFRLQLYGIKATTKLPSNGYKTKKESKNRYIAKPYPTFFTNAKNGWQEKIHEFLLVKEKEHGYK